MRRLLIFSVLSAFLIGADTVSAKQGKKYGPKHKPTPVVQVAKPDTKTVEPTQKRREKASEKAAKREAKVIERARKRAAHSRPVATAGVKPRMRFRGMDRNHNGIISRDEWRGNDVSFRIRDWNRDGVLAGDEVRPGAHRPADFPLRFVTLDRNNDGVIARSEWHAKLKTFERLDTNHDGMLSQGEFSRR